MRSFSHLLASYISDPNSALVRNLKTEEDVYALFSRLEELADKDGKINYRGVETTIERMREYIGTLRRYPVLRANGLYAVR